MQKPDFNVEYNVSLDKLRSVYEFYNSFSFLVGKEVTFTIAPSRCSDIQEVKKKVMRMCVGRLKYTRPVAYMLTRENHQNGWPHVHGIVWYHKDRDNSLTLSGGRLFVEEKQEGMKYSRKNWLYNELGRVDIQELRDEPYVQKKCIERCGEKYCKHEKKEIPWSDWLEYICKDQSVNWRESNVIVRSDIDVSSFFSKLNVETFVD